MSSPEVCNDFNLLSARRKDKLLCLHHPAVLSAAAHLKLAAELKRNQTFQSGVAKHMRLVSTALLWSSEQRRGKGLLLLLSL